MKLPCTITATILLAWACTDSNSPAIHNDLPDISSFSSSPSNCFIISNNDLVKVSRGSPFTGAAQNCAHPGAHLNFTDTGFDYTVNIYAPAHGKIHRVTPCLDLGNNNDKYEIDIAFAHSKNALVLFCISLEPFAAKLCESNIDFYKTYIFVNEGQEVSKGEIIGQLYKKAGTPDDTHIHFMLKKEPGESFHCPNIFNEEISAAFELLYSDQSCTNTLFGSSGFCYLPAAGEDLTGL